MPTPYSLHVCRPILRWLAPAYLMAVSGGGGGVYAWMYANAHMACLQALQW